MAKFYATSPPRKKDVPDAVRRILASLPNDFHVCLEFPAIKDFDIAIFHRRGIHVVEVKNERNIIKGGPNVAYWTVQDEAGVVIPPTRENFYNQAKVCANELRHFLRQKSASILLSPCSPARCGNKLCKLHSEFWYRCRIFPYVCIPAWNPRNEIEPDNTGWCLLTQGSRDLSSPRHLLDAILARDWTTHEQTRPLALSEEEITNVTRELGLRQITVEEALGHPRRWHDTLDERVQRYLREEELARLSQALKQSPILAIVGEAKIGKTTLAQLFAVDVQENGVPILYHDFRVDTPAIMLERFLTWAGTIQIGVYDNISAFVSLLRDESYCVIFDHLDSMLDAGGEIVEGIISRLLDALLASAAKSNMRSLVVMTSRYPVHTQSQNRIPEFSLRGIGRGLAVEYLRNDYRWSEDQAACIYDIRPGHPLAMHVLSTEIREGMALGLSFEQARKQLSPRITELTFGELYSRLTPEQRTLVEVVALLPSGINIEGVEWIAQRRGLKGPVAQNCLGSA